MVRVGISGNDIQYREHHRDLNGLHCQDATVTFTTSTVIRLVINIMQYYVTAKNKICDKVKRIFFNNYKKIW